jgi:AraC-like DNA-binding protein
MEALKRAAWRYADDHADADGLVATPVEDVRMMRVRAPTGPMRAMYKPVLCLVLQGAKQLMAGEEAHSFVAGQSVIVGVDRPVVGRVTRASREEPYLAVALDLDMGVMREVMGQAPGTAETPSRHDDDALLVEDTGEAVADCALHLVRLLDRLEAVPVLRRSIVKEMHYWLLAGRHGAAIRRLALPDSHAQRVARAVAILRAEFARPVPVERLAAAAGMSPSSFHQHFKAVTSLSPLQFQKQLRLLEARRLMVGDGLSASRAAFEVGYESVPQFTREYGRMFGAPPRRDASQSRVAA